MGKATHWLLKGLKVSYSKLSEASEFLADKQPYEKPQDQD